MTIVELHPEELLDREASGALTAAEREVLAAHAARCSACACERRLRVAFADVLRDPIAPSAALPPPPPLVSSGGEAEVPPASSLRARARPLRAALGWLAAVAPAEAPFEPLAVARLPDDRPQPSPILGKMRFAERTEPCAVLAGVRLLHSGERRI